ncbi:unnamed protein product [Adineta steineri]|uniref:Uncharacterized protein n=1 Tax=Adineta steineri TaxID=433720 RepID=A0A813XKQ9_9BILA|nr:unnamed protein product [Adineta steineri]
MITLTPPINNPRSLKSQLASELTQIESSSTDDDDDDDNVELTPNLNNTKHDITSWHHQIAKRLISINDDLHVIITKFDENTHDEIENNIRYKIIKFELMRIALMLNPTELATYNVNESIVPYIDLKQQLGNLFIENKTYEHDQLRLKINDILLKLKHKMDKLRSILFNSSDQDKSLYYIRKYRKKTASSLIDIREHMIEYNRINQILEQDDEVTKHQKTINQVITEMFKKNALIDQRIADYKILIKEYKDKYEFLSSPVISYSSESPRKSLSEDDLLSFEPLEFPDLHCEANEFFDSDPVILQKNNISCLYKTICQTTFKIKHNPRICAYLLNTSRLLSEDQCYVLSLKLEPRATRAGVTNPSV